MDKPPERDKTTHPKPGNAESTPAPEAPESAARSIRGAQLHIIPIDPHRVFAHWYVAPEAMAGLGPGEARTDQGALALRIMGVETGQAGSREITPREDFPVDPGWHESFFSLTQPGGTVAAVLGVKGRDDEFSAFVSSLPVTLPEAPAMMRPRGRRRARPTRAVAAPAPSPATAPPPRPAPARVEAVPEMGETHVPSRPRPVESRELDETAILTAIIEHGDLPAELKALPPREPMNGVTTDLASPASREAARSAAAEIASESLAPAGLPTTPALDERKVIEVVLRALLPPEPGRPRREEILESSAPRAPGEMDESPPGAGREDFSPVTGSELPTESSPVPAPSSLRLASHWSGAAEGAPFFFQARLVLSGRVPDGHRLRIEGREVPVLSDGQFVHLQPISSFHTAWALLEHSLQSPRSGASASCAHAASANAQIPLRFEFEIEGGINDPSYHDLIPEGLRLDAAGRFRLIRPLPADIVPPPVVELLAG